MTASIGLADHYADVLRDVGPVSIERFFGGWSLIADGAQFAIVMDTLYLRCDDDLRSELEERGGRPFTYEARGRTVTVGRYTSVPDDLIDDRDQLVELASAALSNI